MNDEDRATRAASFNANADHLEARGKLVEELVKELGDDDWAVEPFDEADRGARFAALRDLNGYAADLYHRAAGRRKAAFDELTRGVA